MSDADEVVRLPGGTPVRKANPSFEEPSTPPDVRVWLSATGSPAAAFEPSTFHDSRSCANRGGGEPIPSFVGYCTDLDPCGTCGSAFERGDA